VRHGIAQVVSDEVPGVGEVFRQTRLSITFRKVVSQKPKTSKSVPLAAGQTTLQFSSSITPSSPSAPSFF